MVWEEGSHEWDPPLTQPQKEGGIPPHPPSFRWVERTRDRGPRWVYREPGKAQCIFTAKGRCLIGPPLWLLMFGFCS